MNLVNKVLATTTTSGSWNFLRPTDPTVGTTWQVVVNNVIDIVLLVAGALAVIYLIYSGILYITAGGNPDSAKKGQQGIINAVIGIIIIMAAFFIIRIAFGLGQNVTTG